MEPLDHSEDSTFASQTMFRPTLGYNGVIDMTSSKSKSDRTPVTVTRLPSNRRAAGETSRRHLPPASRLSTNWPPSSTSVSALGIIKNEQRNRHFVPIREDRHFPHIASAAPYAAVKHNSADRIGQDKTRLRC